MINVNQITSQLARMPDQALQQYAMMHKNDPYTVSLALSESNRRKQMRDAAQGQQGMAPQPKVVDQGIAGMAAPAPQPMPEDVGIGALPAPNMQGMAGGGIVAFGGGGDVPGYAPGGVPRVGSHGLASIIPDKTGYEGMGIMEFLQAFGTDMLNKLPTEEKVRLQQNQAKKEAAAAPSMQAYRPRPTMEAGQEAALYEKVGLMPPVVIPTPEGTAPAAGPVVPTVPAPGAVPAAGGPRPALAPAAPRAPVVPEKDYLTQLEDMRKKRGAVVDPYAEDTKAITAEDIKGREEGIAALKADQKAEMESMFKGREERIGKREAELGKSKDTNTGMAFLEAGLAMMQARGPGLAGIAQGAGVGLKQYQSGIKDIRAAQEKLDDARDRIEELRQNRESMNKSEIRTEQKGIRDTVLAGKRDLLTGVKTATGVSDADFRTSVASNINVAEARKTRDAQAEQGGLDRASREKIAAMPSAQIQMITTLGNGNFAKGYEIYKQEAAIPRLYESYTKMASDPLKGADFQAKYPTFETYRAGMDGGGKILNIPDAAAGAVRTR
jgi:hypothetical protein